MEGKPSWDSPDMTCSLQQSIIDGVTEPIMVIGLDYQVWMMNRAAREFSSQDTTLPLSCYCVSHQRETPCDGMEHPCPLEQVRKTGKPVTVVHEHCQENGTRRFVEVIAAPLRGADGTLLGIIESIRDVTERTQARKELEQYALKLRALAAQHVEVADTERQRLAQELHDQVGQNLTAIGINLNIIQMQLPKDIGDPVRSRLHDSLSLVEQTTERIRDVMADLRPPVLDDYGLLAALHWYGEQFAWRTNIAVVVEGDESVPRLAPRIENALFRIAQEALTNVAKHAHATSVGVTVKADDDLFHLVIADDGIGFDVACPGDSIEGQGWGLLTMAERAEAVGGRCSVKSVQGTGTQVIVEVPR